MTETQTLDNKPMDITIQGYKVVEKPLTLRKLS